MRKKKKKFEKVDPSKGKYIMGKKNKKIPAPPKPPLSRMIRERTIGDCPKCGSTTIKKWFGLGKSIGCIQPECDNYFKKYVV